MDSTSSFQLESKEITKTKFDAFKDKISHLSNKVNDSFYFKAVKLALAIYFVVSQILLKREFDSLSNSIKQSESTIRKLDEESIITRLNSLNSLRLSKESVNNSEVALNKTTNILKSLTLINITVESVQGKTAILTQDVLNLVSDVLKSQQIATSSSESSSRSLNISVSLEKKANEISESIKRINDTTVGLNRTIEDVKIKTDSAISFVSNITKIIFTLNSTVTNIDSTIGDLGTKTDSIEQLVNKTSDLINDVSKFTTSLNVTVNEVQFTTENIIKSVTSVVSTVEALNSSILGVNYTLGVLSAKTGDISVLVGDVNSSVVSLSENVFDTVNLINSTANQRYSIITGQFASTISSLKLSVNGDTPFYIDFPSRCNWLPSTGVNGYDDSMNSAKLDTISAPRSYSSGGLNGMYYGFETCQAVSLIRGCSPIFPGWTPNVFMRVDFLQVCFSKCNSGSDLGCSDSIGRTLRYPDYNCYPSRFTCFDYDKCVREKTLSDGSVTIKVVSDLKNCF